MRIDEKMKTIQRHENTVRKRICDGKTFRNKRAGQLKTGKEP